MSPPGGLIVEDLQYANGKATWLGLPAINCSDASSARALLAMRPFRNRGI
jgi:hypothetical protein